MNPAGTLEFKGLYSEQLYLKDIQDKTGLKMEVIRYGKYKSAAEPFIANEMSTVNREQIGVYLNSIWKQVKEDISESRHIEVAQLGSIANSLLARNAVLDKNSDLIDRIVYYDEYINGLKYAMNVDHADDIERITIADYAIHTTDKLDSKCNSHRIAVIFAEGDIINGEGDENNVG